MKHKYSALPYRALLDTPGMHRVQTFEQNNKQFMRYQKFKFELVLLTGVKAKAQMFVCLYSCFVVRVCICMYVCVYVCIGEKV